MASRAARRFLVYAVLSTDVSHFRWFSLGYAVNFAASIFLLSAQLWLVWAPNGKPLRNFRYGISSYG